MEFCILSISKIVKRNCNIFLLFLFFYPCSFVVCQSSSQFSISQSGLTFSYDLYKDKNLRLRSLLPGGFKPKVKFDSLNIDIDAETFILITGENRDAHHGAKLNGASASNRLIFIQKIEKEIKDGKEIILVHYDSVKNLKIESHYQFNDFSPVVIRFIN